MSEEPNIPVSDFPEWIDWKKEHSGWSNEKCELCGGPTTNANVQWCNDHAEQFKGKVFCKSCQRVV